MMKFNELYWKQNREALNSFFDQNWSHKDMSLIYETLGCHVNPTLTKQFISHLFLFCTTGINWLFVPKYANAIQPLLVYYFCVLIIILVLIYICIWIEDEIL